MDRASTNFTGEGDSPRGGWQDLPAVDRTAQRDPARYVAGPDTVAAVNVALTLGMPLLLTGEPGSGKSQLAYRLAWELGFPKLREDDEWPEPLRYVVKSTTEARDLFYSFDTVGRFHAAQARRAAERRAHDDRREFDSSGDAVTTKRSFAGEDVPADSDSSEDGPAPAGPVEVSAVDPVNFIEYQALGLAILRAKGLDGLRRDDKLHLLGEHHRRYVAAEPIRSVVLIDEIDKAPRDVPNDILAELEEMSFIVAEIGRQEIRVRRDDEAFRPVVVITSNSERDLPEAFLRRCVYHHLPFPSADSLEQIVLSRLGERYKGFDRGLEEALDLFHFVRRHADDLEKPPSVAELLNWLELLHAEHLADGSVASLADIGEPLYRGVRQTLLKTRDDHDAANAWLAEWKPGAGRA